MNWWVTPAAKKPIKAKIEEIPSSKSLNNRYLILAAIAKGPTTINNYLKARDALLMENALKSLGIKIIKNKDRMQIFPNFNAKNKVIIHCGLSGTVMRFTPLLSALRNGDTKFDGDKQARQRPMQATIVSLENLNIKVTRHNGNFLPFTVHGRGEILGGKIYIDASISSQFISALLLIGSQTKYGLEIINTSKNIPSLLYINMTCDLLRNLGVLIRYQHPNKWLILPKKFKGFDISVEPDLSNVTPFACAAMITGGVVEVPFWPKKSLQPGYHLPKILKRFGGKIEYRTINDINHIYFIGPKYLKNPGILDFSAFGELVPNISALCSLSPGSSSIKNIEHIIGHETNRITAILNEFKNLNIRVSRSNSNNQLFFNESNNLRPSKFLTYNDHRMATTASIIGLKISGIEVENINTTSKTMPNFKNMWIKMVRENASMAKI